VARGDIASLHSKAQGAVCKKFSIDWIAWSMSGARGEDNDLQVFQPFFLFSTQSYFSIICPLKMP